MQHEVPVLNLGQLAVELLMKFHFDYLVDFRSVSANSKNSLLGPEGFLLYRGLKLETNFIVFAPIRRLCIYLVRSPLALPIGLSATVSEVRICDGYDSF